MDDLAQEAVSLGNNERLKAILKDICSLTGMGFAAVARVTDHRWIACQVLDKIDFGMDPGDELKIRETICDEIRDSGEAVVFDEGATTSNGRGIRCPSFTVSRVIAPFPYISTTGHSSARFAQLTQPGERSATKRSF